MVAMLAKLAGYDAYAVLLCWQSWLFCLCLLAGYAVGMCCLDILNILRMMGAYAAFYAGTSAWLIWLCWKNMMAGYSERFCSLNMLIMQAVNAVYPEWLRWLFWLF
jgi:hypothetical protein